MILSFSASTRCNASSDSAAFRSSAEASLHCSHGFGFEGDKSLLEELELPRDSEGKRMLLKGRRSVLIWCHMRALVCEQVVLGSVRQ